MKIRNGNRSKRMAYCPKSLVGTTLSRCGDTHASRPGCCSCPSRSLARGVFAFRDAGPESRGPLADGCREGAFAQADPAPAAESRPIKVIDAVDLAKVDLAKLRHDELSFGRFMESQPLTAAENFPPWRPGPLLCRRTCPSPTIICRRAFSTTFGPPT